VKGVFGSMEKKIKVLVAKPGLDGHDRGAKIIARTFRDSGMEVIYTGLHQTPDQIVSAAIQEDVDVIGLSILSGAHETIIKKVKEKLETNNADDIIIVCGGIIPDSDIPILKALGVSGVFGPGSSTIEIVEFLKDQMKGK